MTYAVEILFDKLIGSDGQTESYVFTQDSSMPINTCPIDTISLPNCETIVFDVQTKIHLDLTGDEMRIVAKIQVQQEVRLKSSLIVFEMAMVATGWMRV